MPDTYFQDTSDRILTAFSAVLKKSFYKERLLCANVALELQKMDDNYLTTCEMPYSDASKLDTKWDIYICNKDGRKREVFIEVKVMYRDGQSFKKSFFKLFEYDINKIFKVETNKKFYYIIAIEDISPRKSSNGSSLEISKQSADMIADDLKRIFNDILSSPTNKLKITYKKRQVKSKSGLISIYLFYKSK